MLLLLLLLQAVGIVQADVVHKEAAGAVAADPLHAAVTQVTVLELIHVIARSRSQ
jgi:hypothetical protein